MTNTCKQTPDTNPTADRGITWELQIAEEDVSRRSFYIQSLFLTVTALLLEDQRFDTALCRQKQGRRGALEENGQSSSL